MRSTRRARAERDDHQKAQHVQRQTQENVFPLERSDAFGLQRKTRLPKTEQSHVAKNTKTRFFSEAFRDLHEKRFRAQRECVQLRSVPKHVVKWKLGCETLQCNTLLRIWEPTSNPASTQPHFHGTLNLPRKIFADHLHDCVPSWRI